MDNKKRIRRYIRQTSAQIKRISPRIVFDMEKHLNSEEDFETIKKQVTAEKENIIKSYYELLKQQEYFRQLSEEKESLYYMKMPVENKTFYELQKTLIKLQNILGNNFEKLYLAGSIVPYLLLETDSGRLHEDIDTICFEEDINHLREIFKLTPYYSEKWDSIYYNTEDCGFEIQIDGVPISISRATYTDKELKIFDFNPFTNQCTCKIMQTDEISDYFINYFGIDNKLYKCMTLEYIKKTKDGLKRPKDIIDSMVIESMGFRDDIYERITIAEPIILENSKQLTR